MTTENTPAIINNFPSQIELQSVSLIAKTAHLSGLYGGIGGEAKIMMILLTAKELGVGPCQALNGGIWSIQGKVEISARLMNGLIRRAGHSIKVVSSTDAECILLGTRSDGDFFTCSFTMEDAIKAGLAGSNVWKKYPGDMLYNRCMSRLGRRLFSDVIGQCYIEGEIKEAKEIEKKERELQYAECDEIKHNPETLQTFALNAPNNDSIHSLKEENKCGKAENDKLIHHNERDIVIHQNNDPKISAQELHAFLTNYVNTDDVFKENFEKYIFTQWAVADFKDLTEKNFPLVMSWIAKNIEMQSMPRGN